MYDGASGSLLWKWDSQLKNCYLCVCVCVYVTSCSNVVQFDTVRPGCGNSLPVPVAQSDTIKIL